MDKDKVYRMVTKAYLAKGKDGYDVLAKCKQVFGKCDYRNVVRVATLTRVIHAAD